MHIEDYSLSVRLISPDLKIWVKSFHEPCDATNAIIASLEIHGTPIANALFDHHKLNPTSKIIFRFPWSAKRKSSAHREEVFDEVDLKDVRKVFIKYLPEMLRKIGGDRANHAVDHLQLYENNEEIWS